MSTELAKRIITVRELLEKNKNSFALSKYVNVDRLIGIVVGSLRKTPELLNCDQISLLSAIKQSAQLGLEPDGVLGQAYLIPYKGQVQFQIGYQGLMQLARRCNDLISIRARVVYANDKFNYEFGLKEKLEHIPATGERGKLKACYAIAKFKSGDLQFEVMTDEDIEKIKSVSQSLKGSKAEYSPWNLWEDTMWKKTVIKRLCKQLPQAEELQTAVAVDDYVEFDIDSIRTINEIKMPEPIKKESTKKPTKETKSKEKSEKNIQKPEQSEKTVDNSEKQTDFEMLVKEYMEVLGDITVSNILADYFAETPSDVKDEKDKTAIINRLKQIVNAKT